MKQLITVLIVMMVFPGVYLTAAGVQERPARTAESIETIERGGARLSAWGEQIRLTGTIEQEVGRRPVLITHDGSYQLMYPMHIPDEINVSAGDTITVEGVLVPGSRWVSDEPPMVRVEKAVIDGQEYSVAHGMRTVCYGRKMMATPGRRVNAESEPEAWGRRFGGRGR